MDTFLSKIVSNFLSFGTVSFFLALSDQCGKAHVTVSHYIHWPVIPHRDWDFHSHMWNCEVDIPFLAGTTWAESELHQHGWKNAMSKWHRKRKLNQILKWHTIIYFLKYNKASTPIWFKSYFLCHLMTPILSKSVRFIFIYLFCKSTSTYSLASCTFSIAGLV